ncbi:hypothetical protein DUI87_00566 [Hirundo rustica rustica]|uniref:EF-hand domain-containing protein n=1 Tax=Hirundo rustica rustica TaxID=333673 RepID=A0A3M0LA46_HIRRU|nr:hypothetical protein DUI87_00566 [Hirundo rustica rustica]
MMAAAAVVEVSSAGSSSTGTSSTGEEERMKHLFQTCNGDGDGFINSGNQGEPIHHDCLETIEATYSSR